MQAKVTYAHKRPPYWEVTADDNRWWSVAYRLDDNNRAIDRRRADRLRQLRAWHLT